MSQQIANIVNKLLAPDATDKEAGVVYMLLYFIIFPSLAALIISIFLIVWRNL